MNWFNLLATAALVAVAAPSSAAAPQPTWKDLAAQQQSDNALPGPRRVPAKVLPVPTALDSGTAAAVAAPYGAPLWNLDPPDDAAWRAIVARSVELGVPRLAAARATLGVHITPTEIGGVKAFWLEPNAIPASHRHQIVVNIHGGGWTYGPGESGTTEAMLLALYGGYKVLAIDYRMAPDAPFPAGLDDCVAVWRALVRTHDPKRIAVEGTSAGGNLTLALMLRLKASGLPMPGAIAPGSPVSDLTKTGDSFFTNEWIDNVLVSYDGYLGRAIRLYAHGHDLKDPLLSPVYGDLSGLPPAIFTSGTRDLLLSDTIRVQRKMRQAGITAELQVFEGLSHAQYALRSDAPDAREVFSEIAHFFDAHLAR